MYLLNYIQKYIILMIMQNESQMIQCIMIFSLYGVKMC